MRLNKPNFIGHLGLTKIGRSGYFEVVSALPKLQYVVHPDPARVLRELSASDSRTLSKALASTALGSSVSTLEDGREALVSYQPLTMTNWILVAVLPSEEAFGLIELARDRSPMMVALSAVVLVPLVWLVAWGMLKPLIALRDQVDALTLRPDRDARVVEGPATRPVKLPGPSIACSSSKRRWKRRARQASANVPGSL